MKNIFVTIRIDKELHKELKSIAENRTRSLSAQILHFIKQGIEANKKRQDEQND